MDLSSGWNRSAGLQGSRSALVAPKVAQPDMPRAASASSGCTVHTLFVNFKMLRSLLPIADRDSTNHSRDGSVVHDLSHR